MLKELVKSAGFTSFDHLARALVQENPGLAWAQPRSLSAKLGQLNKGETAWWERRREHATVLCRMLGVPPQELGLFWTTRKGFYRFEDFKQLSPVNFFTETPCELGAFECDGERFGSELNSWFGRDRYPGQGPATPTGVTWAYFPPGTGRDFFWAHISALSPFTAKKVSRLSDASSDLLLPTPVCLFLEESNGSRDLEALARRHPESAVFVCAGFRLPDVQEINGGLGSDPVGSLLKLMGETAHNKITRLEWTLNHDWKARLLNWIGERRKSADSLFDAGSLLDWINQQQGMQHMYTPRDLVIFSEFADRLGEKKLPSLKRTGAETTMLEIFIPPKYARFKTAYIELLAKAFKTIELPWGCVFKPKEWGCLIASLDSPDSRDVSTGLIDTPLIRQEADGSINFRTRLLPNVLASRAISDDIKRDTDCVWGSLCFDSSRRNLILQSLKFLNAKELARVTELALNAPIEDVSVIGATEALFCFVGLSSPHEENILPQNILQSLSNRVISRLLVGIHWEATLWSVTSEEVEWISICWRWSFLVPRPDVELSDECCAAYFPGWGSQPLQVACYLTINKHKSLSQLDHAETQMTRVASLVADRCLVDQDTIPTILIPALTLTSLCNNTEVAPAWWVFILSHRWADEYLLSELTRCSVPPERVLGSIVKSLISPGVKEEVMLPTWWHISRLRKYYIDKVDPEELIEEFGENILRYMVCNPAGFPSRFKSPLIAFLDGRRDGYDYFVLISPWLDQYCDQVKQWLEIDYLGVVARYIWRVSAGRAKELIDSDELGELGRKALVREWPLEHIGSDDVLLSGVLKNSYTLEERSNWVRSRLPSSGALAPILLSYI